MLSRRSIVVAQVAQCVQGEKTMHRQPSCANVLAAAGAALPLIAASLAYADVTATLICTRRDVNVAGIESTVPGLPAATMALANANGVRPVWCESSAIAGFLFVPPEVDANGTVYFIGTAATLSHSDPDSGGATRFLLGTAPLTQTANAASSNNRMIFSSTAASGYAFSGVNIVARDGSTSSPVAATAGTGVNGAILGGMSAPLIGVADGNVLNGTNNAGGMTAGMSLAPNGTLLFSSLVAPVSGTSVGSSWFTGNSAGFTQAVNHGAAANGAPAGTTFTMPTAFSVTNSLVSVPVNTSGQAGFVPTLVGPSITIINNSGLWLCGPTANVKVFQKGDAATGTSGSVPGNYAFGVTLQSIDQGNVRINAAGGLLFSNTLASTNLPEGFVAPDATQRSTLWYAPSGGSPQLLVQSGTAVGAAYPGANYANTSSFALTPQNQLITQMLNNSGTVVYNAKFNPSSGTNASTAPITASVNDQAIMQWNGGAATMLFHTGDTPVPGVPGATTFQDLGFASSQTKLNNLGHHTFAATMTDDGVTIVPTSPGVSGNDHGLWLGDGIVGGATLIARAGDPAPEMGGLLFGNSFTNVVMNNSDLVVFMNTPTTATGSQGQVTWFAYGPTFGIVRLFSYGTTSYLGTNYPLVLVQFNSSSNGDGGVQSLNESGVATFMAISAGGNGFAQNAAVMVTHIGPRCGSADYNCDGDLGTDADIEAFFACLAGNCPAPPCTSTADFNGDGDIGTDADIEAFFRVLAGGTC
jgi:hypothetical protein